MHDINDKEENNYGDCEPESCQVLPRVIELVFDGMFIFFELQECIYFKLVGVKLGAN